MRSTCFVLMSLETQRASCTRTETHAFVDGGEKIQVGSYFEFIDEHGRRLPFELWSPDQERRVCELSTRYGSRLKGLILSPDDRGMRLVVGSAPDRLSIQ